MPTTLQTSCLCGAFAQTLTARNTNTNSKTNNNDADENNRKETTKQPVPITLCHCNTCRRTSGVLFTSYCPIEAPSDERLFDEDGLLTGYASSPGTTRYFCRTCGCHVLRRREDEEGQVVWDAATGIIADERDDGDGSHNDRPLLEYVRHEHVDDTGDGGLAVWLPTVGGKSMEGVPQTIPSTDGDDNTSPTERTVSAACHCGSVQLDIRPPDFDLEGARQPHSGFADLLVPYATTDPAITSNPDDVKWWLRPSRHDPTKITRWLAGTCACRSCRLATGFEIQTWAFVPRTSILVGGEVLTFGNSKEGGNGNAPLTLAAYQSTPGVERNFCSRCGATVFWHDMWRPDLIDVSVGLLRPNANTNDGSRVESLLDWCKTRVSFVEEALRDRHGPAAHRGSTLAESLEAAMKGS